MCQHYGIALSEDHRHYVKSAEHDNCVLCLVDDKGPMSLQSVSNHLGISRDEVYKLEKQALKKLKSALGMSKGDLCQRPEPLMPAKSVVFYSNEVLNISQEYPVYWSLKSCPAAKSM